MNVRELKDDIIRLIESKFDDTVLSDEKYSALTDEIEQKIDEFAVELKDKILEIVEE